MTAAGHAAPDPPRDCGLCPRLAGFRAHWRENEPGWHNGPVRTWLPADGASAVRLLIVGLAPGLRGANRTGRAFTGDASGAALFAALEPHGLARGHKPGADGAGIRLIGTAITNAVRCVPPRNRPIASEINNCRPFLENTIQLPARLRVILTLGRIAHEATVRALGEPARRHPFGHGRQSAIGGLAIVSSYHCSRYNMNTGRLTAAMLDDVVGRCSSVAGRR